MFTIRIIRLFQTLFLEPSNAIGPAFTSAGTTIYMKDSIKFIVDG